MIFATRSQRLMGQVLDGLVGLAPLIAAALIASFSDTLARLLSLASLAWVLFYYFFADGLQSGQSFGKRWLGIRVVGSDGRAPCTFGQSFIRNLLLAVLGPVDWIFIFGANHQRLGDKVACTFVITD